MLLDAAAILSTSAGHAVLAEAFAAPATVIVSTAGVDAERAAWDLALDTATGTAPTGLPWIGAPSPFVGPQPAVRSIAAIAELRGVSLLGQLSLLSRAELETFARDYPQVLRETIQHPPAASEVTAWWSRTPSAQRTDLIAATPEIVGNLDGVTFAVRDAANRIALERALDELDARLDSGLGRAAEQEVMAQRATLLEVKKALVPGSSGMPRSLMSLDTADAGRAAVVVGDLDTADYVTFLVPGMWMRLDGQIVDWTEMADALAQEQSDWIDRISGGPSARRGSAWSLDGTAPGHGEVATVSWIGYRTPTLLDVASIELAREGAAVLTSAVQGVQSVRGGDAPFVSIFSHSFGATAAMLAVQENDVTVDVLALLGAPGSPAQSASELKVRDGNVWVGLADWDPIPMSGVFGSQPADHDYGAKRFDVAGGVDPVTGETLLAAVSHNDYLTPGTESFRNLALLGIDRDDLVVREGGASAPVAGKALARSGRP